MKGATRRAATECLQNSGRSKSNSEDAAIVASIVALGRALNLRVVAEGVETQGQREHLKQLGCDVYQGYLLSRPLEPNQLTHLFANVRSKG
ncbi:EAL domain-containing protein [Stenotrophomonas sp. BR163]|uniref:EAL domain-containing protein n=1 Tax=Stenotrophomonas sp. BR163 TaxID=3398459 RepID=UPI0039C642D7